ncbi:CHAT domain-containing protein [Catellatospora sp. NPDC049133]|uniref:CHAT domain-containing protein n=1 Tax=Catellatospora sp. NPDC049133 TaxID=3155499 RepID=UPI0033D93613
MAPEDRAEAAAARLAPQLRERLHTWLADDPYMVGLAEVPLLRAHLYESVAQSEALPQTSSDAYHLAMRRAIDEQHGFTDAAATDRAVDLLAAVATGFATQPEGWADALTAKQITAVLQDEQASADQARLEPLLAQDPQPSDAVPCYTLPHRAVAEVLVAHHLAGLPRDRWLAFVDRHLWFDPDWGPVLNLLGAAFGRRGRWPEAAALLTHLLDRPADAGHQAVFRAARVLIKLSAAAAEIPAALVTAVADRMDGMLDSVADHAELAQLLYWEAANLPEQVIDMLLSRLAAGRGYLPAAILARSADPRATGALVTRLNGTSDAADDAFAALRGTDDEVQLDALMASFDDPDLIGQAAAGLRHCASPRVARRMLDRCGHPDPVVRLHALVALGGRNEPEVLDAALRLAEDPHPDVRIAAMCCLARRHEANATDALVRHLHDEDRFVRVVARAMAFQPDRFTPRQLRDYSLDPDAGLRMHALSVYPAEDLAPDDKLPAAEPDRPDESAEAEPDVGLDAETAQESADLSEPEATPANLISPSTSPDAAVPAQAAEKPAQSTDLQQLLHLCDLADLPAQPGLAEAYRTAITLAGNIYRALPDAERSRVRQALAHLAEAVDAMTDPVPDPAEPAPARLPAGEVLVELAGPNAADDLFWQYLLLDARGSWCLGLVRGTDLSHWATDFGELIETGYGLPDPDVAERVRRHYGQVAAPGATDGQVALAYAVAQRPGWHVPAPWAQYRPAQAELEPAAHRASHLELTRRAGELIDLYDQSGDLTKLKQAVELRRQAAAATPPRHPRAGTRHLDLSNSLTRLFDREADLALLHEAIAADRAAVAATPTTDPDHAVGQDYLAWDLMVLSRETTDTTVVPEVVQARRAALAATPAEDLQHPQRRRNLADALLWAFEHTNDLADGWESATILRELVAAGSDDDAEQRERTHVLGAMLTTLFNRTGDLETLASAIDNLRTAADLAPPDSPDRGRYLTGLGTALRLRAERQGDLASLHEAAAVGRAGASIDSPLRALVLTDLSTILVSLYDKTWDMAVLQEAVEAGRAALAATRDGTYDQVLVLVNLSLVLRILYTRTGDESSQREAVDAARRAAALLPPEHPHLAQVRYNLALGLLGLHRATGDDDMLHEAVQHGRAVVDSAGPDHGHRAMQLHLLSSILRRLHLHTGDVASLHEAVETARSAVAATPQGHGQLAAHLDNLSLCLLNLYHVTGDRGTLHDAVAVSRSVTAAVADGDANRMHYLVSFSNSLHNLYIQTAEPDLLREAVSAARAALSTIPPDHPLRHRALAVLSTALRQLSEATGGRDALDEAVAVARQVLSAAGPTRADRLTGLESLGNALTSLYRWNDDPDTAREAVHIWRTAVRSAPTDHRSLRGYQGSLASMLALYAKRTGDAAALAEGTDLYRTIAAELPEVHPHRAPYLSDLADSLFLAYEWHGDRTALRQAQDAYRQAAASPSAGIRLRILNERSKARADAASGDHETALASIERALELLPLLASRHLARADRAHRLGQVAGVAAQAAAVAVAAGRPDRAVELLEQARGQLLAEAMGNSEDLRRLRSSLPELADRFTRTRARLAAVETDPDTPAGSGQAAAPAVETAALRRAAADELQALLARIRAEPGFAGFLAPAPVEQLRLHAGEGPIVMVTTDPLRCDALILTADPHRPVLHVPLPDLTHEDVLNKAARFRGALAAVHDDRHSISTQARAQQTVRDILAWLWDTTTAPVLTALGHTRTSPDDSWPRVWWCPVGVLAHLPLHAAGYHDDVRAGAAEPRTVLDRVVSSYTATIHALAHARQRPSGAAADRPALIVSMPQTPGAPDLPGAARETDLIASLLPGARILQGAEATRDAVVSALGQHPMAHFACHGSTDWNAPDHSRLYLHDHADHPLTVAALSRLRLPDADLAYLSACETTETQLRLADEAIHITAAFQVAGYRSVVGTLWQVSDQASTTLASHFYTNLTEGAPSAQALHHATRELRRRSLRAPSRWAAYIHTGI